MKKEHNSTKSHNLSSTDTLFDFSTNVLIHSEIELPLGWHSQTEIIHIIDGEGMFNISGKRTSVRPGSFIIINPNQIHSGHAVIGRPLKYQSLKFSYKYFESFKNDPVHTEFVLPLLSGDSYLPNTIQLSFPIHHMVEVIFESVSKIYYKKDFGYELGIRTKLFELLFTFYSNKFIYHRTTPKKIALSEETVKNTIEYIHNNYEESFTLDYLADMSNTSKPHLCRTFKRMTAQTITEYQNSYRIKKACELLSHTDDKIVSIAFQVGYNNISYFNERFRQKTLLTPIEYRQTHRGD
jgi:AraC-like DNA-binding protein